MRADHVVSRQNKVVFRQNIQIRLPDRVLAEYT